jgi:hypothetical protein
MERRPASRAFFAWGETPGVGIRTSRVRVCRRQVNRGARSVRLWWEVKDDRGRSVVQESLDNLRERVRIFNAGARIEPGDAEEFSVALDAAVYPPRPYVLALSTASDLDSRHTHLIGSRVAQRALSCQCVSTVADSWPGRTSGCPGSKQRWSYMSLVSQTGS